MPLVLLLACGNTEDQSYSYGSGNAGKDASTSSDSDGDGFSDEEEINAGTNPNFASSHPYEHGEYIVGSCSQGLPSELGTTESVSMNLEGQNFSWNLYAAGDGVENIILKDQFDQDVELHSFCGVHIMLVVSSFI